MAVGILLSGQPQLSGLLPHVMATSHEGRPQEGRPVVKERSHGRTHRWQEKHWSTGSKHDGSHVACADTRVEEMMSKKQVAAAFCFSRRLTAHSSLLSSQPRGAADSCRSQRIRDCGELQPHSSDQGPGRGQDKYLLPICSIKYA